MFAAAKGKNWNKRQLDGTVDEILKPFNIEEKFRVFGFGFCTVNGNDASGGQSEVRRAKSVKQVAKKHARFSFYCACFLLFFSSMLRFRCNQLCFFIL